MRLAPLLLPALLAGTFAACQPSTPAATPTEPTATAPAPPAFPPPSAPPVLTASLKAALTAEPMVVYKTATCGCCHAWVDYLKAAGVTVDARDVTDLAAVKDSLGLPQGLGSCHTARVGGYTVEGHVPAEDIARLLAERPADVEGIAVPGMPTGSPGMEVPGRPADPYDVVAYDARGGQRVWASHNK